MTRKSIQLGFFITMLTASAAAQTTVTTTGGTANTVTKFSGASTVANSIIVDTGSGVGIGRTPAANTMLDVNGSAIIRGASDISRTADAAKSAGANSFPLIFSPEVWYSTSNSAIVPTFQWQAEVTGNNTASPSTTLNLLSSNGITTSPSETGLSINQNGIFTFAPGQTFPGTETIGSGGISGTAGYLPLFTGSATVGNSIMTQSGGNIGIGTTNPTAQLHIYGTGNQILSLQSTTASFPGISFANPGFNYSNQLDAINGSLYWWNGSTRNMTLLQNGHLGIGTTAPGAMLDVNGQIVIEQKNFGGPAGLLIEGNTVGNNYPNIGFSLVNSNGANVVADTLTGFITNATAGSESMGVALSTINSGSAVSDIYITPAGNIGIGTTAPAYSLDVAGVARAQSGIIYPDGNKQTVAWTGVLCGGDYAEAVKTKDELKNYGPGDVLVIASGKESDVEKASTPYSTTVAGIYATKPGVIGRRQSLSKDTDDLPMAMVGIVPAKVSAENGPIQKGDLLVTASTPGYAMKGTDRSRMLGAVIGKAMGDLDSGIGEIEVLVTLQ